MKGRCLRGGIIYEINQLHGPIVVCHCPTCRKAHAASPVEQDCGQP